MHFNNKIGFLSLLLASLLITNSCDSGDIVEKDYVDENQTYTIVVRGKIVGKTEEWPSNYNICVAAFVDDGAYSVIQKNVSPDVSGNVEVTLLGIPSNATRLSFCATNSLRREIASFKDMQIAKGEENQVFDMGEVDVNMFNVIQKEVFDGAAYNCSMCHGIDNPRADMSLTRGYSYTQLVNVASSRVKDGVRVIPGNAEESVLFKAVQEGNAIGLRFDHSNLLPSTLRRLIEDWINAGAKE